MTVLATTSSQFFPGSGNNGPFTWTWRFLANGDISVFKLVGGVETLLVAGDDYAIAGAGSYQGGSIITVAAVEVGEELYVERNTELLQRLDLRNQGDFFPETYEDALDRRAMAMIDQQRQGDRSIKMPASVEGDFNIPSGPRANTLFGFDGDGNPELKTAAFSILTHQVIGATVIVDADASVGPVTVNLPNSGEVLITKTDATANLVTIATLDGKTIQRGAGYELSGQDEFVRLIEADGNWRRS